MGFWLLESAEETKAAFEAFRESFADGADEMGDTVIRCQSRQVEVEWLYWHPKRHLWGFFGVAGNDKRGDPTRYWCPFGLVEKLHADVEALIEINPPLWGKGNCSQGRFFKDDGGNLFVGHLGKVTGGTGGPSLLSRPELKKRVEQVSGPKGDGPVIRVAELESKSFLDDLQEFVREVYIHKNP